METEVRQVVFLNSEAEFGGDYFGLFQLKNSGRQK